MAVEKRPVASAASTLLDFSKDSLNSTGLQEQQKSSPVQHQATATRHVEEEENNCTETVKLEPLAFTIDFGDVGKKKETPKRFSERLVGANKRSTPSSSSNSPKAEASKKVIESQLRH